jgi:MFS superfamily sulfate permease-like transporter
MAGMAALLLVVAWNMSEAPKALHLLKTAPASDVLVFLTCFTLTVIFDMVIAIGTGMVLAALLFMKEIADMTKVSDISENRRLVSEPPPPGWCILKISGPLFFAAADRVFGEIAEGCSKRRGIVLYLDGVPILDAGGLSALEKLVERCGANGTQLVLTDLQFQPLKTLWPGLGWRPLRACCGSRRHWARRCRACLRNRSPRQHEQPQGDSLPGYSSSTGSGGVVFNLPAARRDSRRTYSICPLSERRSSSAQRCIASITAGLMRSG